MGRYPETWNLFVPKSHFSSSGMEKIVKNSFNHKITRLALKSDLLAFFWWVIHCCTIIFVGLVETYVNEKKGDVFCNLHIYLL